MLSAVKAVPSSDQVRDCSAAEPIGAAQDAPQIIGVILRNHAADATGRTMVPDDTDHTARVQAWMVGVKTLPPAQRVTRFEQALGGLWRRALGTLGEITLTAIVDRVFYTASERYPFLSALKVEGNGIRFDEFREQGSVLHDNQFLEAVCFVLVEFLTVLGNLTAEILTPALHAELSKTAVKEIERTEKGAQDQSGATAGDDDGLKGTKS
jgi:hypothetical protein